jgi:hypothetical protein
MAYGPILPPTHTCPLPFSLEHHRYESEAAYFDSKVREEKMVELRAKVEALIEPMVAQQTSTLASIKLG